MPKLITKRTGQNGRVSWQARVPVGLGPTGKPLHDTRTFQTHREAKDHVTKIRQERVEGRTTTPSKMTLNRYLDEWIERERTNKTVRSQTAGSYAGVLTRYIRPRLGNVRLAELTPLSVQRQVDALARLGLSPRTVAYALSLLRKALKDAVRLRLLPSNPAADVRPPRRVRGEMPAFNEDQARAFVAALQDTKHETLFLLALLTGMRPGEYLALKWDDLNLRDPADCSVTVRRVLVQDSHGWHFDEPKTLRSRRTIPIPDVLAPALKRHKTAQAEQRLALGEAWEDHGLVFTNEVGAPLDRKNLLRRHFRPLLRQAGLPEKIRLYDLRHSAATLLLGLGVHPKIASERLGHASITQTLDTYSHVMPTMQREATDKLEQLLLQPRSQAPGT